MIRMVGKRVLVTGAARGIGNGIAKRFLQEGAKVILTDKRESDLEKTTVDFKQNGWEADFVVCNLRHEAELTEMAEWAWDHWDGIDILINNAGLAVREPFTNIPLANWDEIMEVNLRATFLLGQCIAKKMMDKHVQGAIVNMTSKNGLSGSSKLAHYNASKAGIHRLTQSMAVDLAVHGIRVNAVAPGFIDTPLDQELKQKEENLHLTEKTPMKRLGTVEEVANAVLFLASDEASYITGTTLVVDGGHLANASEI